MNPKVQEGLRIAVIAGSAIIVVGAGYALLKTKIGTASIMPAITMLVGISAFTYAMNNPNMTLVPKV